MTLAELLSQRPKSVSFVITVLLVAYAYLRPRGGVLQAIWTRVLLAKYNQISLPSLESALSMEDHRLGSSFRLTLKERNEAVRRLACSLWKERFVWRPVISTSDPRHMQLFRRMYRSPRMKQIGPFLGEESIVFQDGERGRHDRLLLNKAFDRHEFERMHPVMREASKRLRNRLLYPTQATTELEIKRTTLEVICEGGFGYQIKDDQAFRHITQLLEIAINPIAFLPGGTWLLQLWNWRTLKFVHSIVGDIVDNRLAEVNRDGSEHRDLLQLLMSVSEEDLATYNVSKKVWLRDQLQLFCFAGTDTSSSVLSWGLAMLALRPDLQDKLQTELDEACVGTHDDEPPSYAHLNSLRYLEAFIKETLRLYSPVRGLTRVFEKDQLAAEIDAIPVPENVPIHFDFQAMHLRDDYFSRPFEFLPERWLLDGKDPSLPTARPEGFIAFSSGFRACIGRGFAMHEIKTMLGTLLRTHRVLRAANETRTEMPNGSYRKGVMFPDPPFNIQLVQRVDRPLLLSPESTATGP